MRTTLTVLAITTLSAFSPLFVAADFHIFRSEFQGVDSKKKPAYYAATALEYNCTFNPEQKPVSGRPDQDWETEISIYGLCGTELTALTRSSQHDWFGFSIQAGNQSRTAEPVTCLANWRVGSATCRGRYIDEILFCTTDVCGPIGEVKGLFNLTAQDADDWDEY